MSSSAEPLFRRSEGSPSYAALARKPKRTTVPLRGGGEPGARSLINENLKLGMVGPNGFEPSTSSVSRKRSGPAELRAYIKLRGASILSGRAESGNVGVQNSRTASGHRLLARRHSSLPGCNERRPRRQSLS